MEELTECPRCGRLRPRSTHSSLKGNCPYCLIAFALGDDNEPPADADGEMPADGPAVPLERLGPYTILAPLGSGGMGTVYRARHEGLSRVVALKILKPEFAGRPGFTERFQREGQVLAALAHPHIIGVHDLGCEAGVYYLAMEYVEGQTLRERLRRGRLASNEALGYFAQMALALEAAHQRGVVHRDIKPENVLVDSTGQVKIADFGIAKLIEGSLAGAEHATEVGLVAGTRSYMAPEQLEPGRAIDPRADLYSLAVVLYEMLTGELPLGVFAPPSRTAGVDQGLDGPILRALAKDPGARPADAKRFLEQIQRASAAEAEPLAPVLARGNRWLRPALGVGVLAVLVTVAWSALRNNGGTPGGAPVAPLPVPKTALARPGVLEHDARVWDVAFSPHEAVVATAGEDGLVKFWSTAGGAPLASLTVYPHADLGYLRLAFAPKEPILATAGGENLARLWDLPADRSTARERSVLRGHSREIVALAFSPDGSRVATASHDRSVKLWRTRDGALEQTLTGPTDPVLCVAFSPEGDRVAAGVMNGAVKLWEISGKEIPSGTGHAKRVWGVAFTPEGQLVSASNDQTIKICDPAKKKLLHTLSNDGDVWSVAVSGEGRLLVCGMQDGTIRWWSYETGAPLGKIKAHRGPVMAVRFSADGKLLASASLDRTARVLEVEKAIRESQPSP